MTHSISNHLLRGSTLLLFLSLAACASYLPTEFVPADAENLNEWQVEGQIKIKPLNNNKESGSAKIPSTKAHFVYTHIDGEEEWRFHPSSNRVRPFLTLDGEGNIKDKHPALDENFLSAAKNLPLENMQYWLRALPAGAEATTEENKYSLNKTINEAGWDIAFDSFMQINEYALPNKININGEDNHIGFNLVRAEAGFLTHPCQDFAEPKTNAPNNISNKKDAVELLVPYDGSAPLPRWIDKDSFCQQLIKVHGKVPDPHIGLYGPDSMVWRLTAPYLVGSSSAGRTLLLQAAHPWVTAGVDEHSSFREDHINRARRTLIRTMAMIYGSMPQVMASANRVHRVHKEVKGEIPYDAGAFKKHSEYRANEVGAMIWVHATMWDGVMQLYEEIEGPLSQAEKDQYYEESKLFAMLFGIPEEALPEDWNAFTEYIDRMYQSDLLHVNRNTKAIKRDLFHPGDFWLWAPLRIHEIQTAAYLPPNIREDFDMSYGPFSRFSMFFIRNGSRFANWITPDFFNYNPLHHEAKARLEGKRVNPYHRSLIKNLLGTERIVN